MKKGLAVLVMLVVLAPVSVHAGKYDDVLLQADGNCAKPCVVIGHITRNSGLGSCAKKIRKYAKKKYDADAVLKYDVEPRGNELGKQCKGIAVRWAKDGEVGIAKVTDDTPIPVIN